jgi:hypothetical protein
MEYTRDTQCDRCHLWFDKDDLNVVGEGDGLLLCTRCVEAVWPSEYPEDEDYASRITHEGQFEDEPCADAVQLLDENESLAVLVRTTAGLRIEAVADPFYIVATQDGKSVTADVSPADLWDAFNHPALYLSPEQCSLIGLR